MMSRNGLVRNLGLLPFYPVDLCASFRLVSFVYIFFFVAFVLLLVFMETEEFNKSLI